MALTLVAPVLLVPAVLLLALDRPPDVLVADTTQALAVRGEAGLELVAGKAGSFAVMIWRETWEDPLEAAPAGSFGCDSLGCTGVSSAGFSWTVARDAGAVFEDCGVVDLIVVRRPLEVPCAGSLIVDQRALERRGVHWLRWRGADFEVRRALAGRGDCGGSHTRPTDTKISICNEMLTFLDVVHQKKCGKDCHISHDHERIMNGF